MSFLRHKQRAFTALFPHKGNKRYIIPKKNMGYRELSWSTIPGQQFYTGIPASVDFRAWLSGTNRATATITTGAAYPAGFTFNNGVLSWDGTGSPSPGLEQSCIASDGEGPDAESALFTVSVVDYTALSWSGPLFWAPSQNGQVQTFDIRAELSGTNAATATINLSPGLPSGYTFDGSILTYDGNSANDINDQVVANDGIGPAALADIDVIPALDVSLVTQSFSISEKNGTLDSRDPNYLYNALLWAIPQGDLLVQEGVPLSFDARTRLSGTNKDTANITHSGDTASIGVAFDNGVYSYDGVAPAGNAVVDTLSADDGISSDTSEPFNVQIIPAPTGNFSPVDPRYTVTGGVGESFRVQDSGSSFGTRRAGNGSTGEYLFDRQGDVYINGQKFNPYQGLPNGTSIPAGAPPNPWRGSGYGNGDLAGVETADPHYLFPQMVPFPGNDNPQYGWITSPNGVPDPAVADRALSLYMRWYIKFNESQKDPNATSQSNKLHRVYATYSGGDTGVHDAFVDVGKVSFKPPNASKGMSGAPDMTPNVWHLCEFYVSVENRRVAFWFDGAKRSDSNDIDPSIRPDWSTSTGIYPRGWGFDASGNSSFPTLTCALSDYFCSQGFQRLEIGDSGQGLYNCTIREPQPTASWAANDIQGADEWYLGRHSTLAGLFLYVVDANNNDTLLGQFV